MKKRLAFICAFPAGLNPGMLSVDLASSDLLAGASGQLEVVHFCAEQAVDLAGVHRSLRYRHLQRLEQLEDFDAIVFWGDFLHWIGYGTRDYLSRQTKRMPDSPQADILDSWYQLFLLEGRPDLQRKAVVFGSTIYGLHVQQLSNDRYMSALQSLYRHARLVLLRDVFSATFARQLGTLPYDAFGCDCALLLDTSAWAPARMTDRPYAVCSFARSGTSVTLGAFAGIVGQTAGLEMVNLQWFDMSGLKGLERKLSVIRGAKFVITDTYHLAISALREGVPALCIGWGAQGIEGSLSDKKKEIFFQQSMLRPNYLFVEQIFEAMRSDTSTVNLARTALKAVSDGLALGLAFELLRKQAAQAAQRCRQALDLASH